MPLRLKSLELQGYKTFATRTAFEFAGGITAIVGPNGSGKSNIADALRWVLGEQSYGLLRAKKTEDMIFAGSETRTRAGMASVSVLFDNEVGWLPLDFAEVSMGRRAYRDGRNDYLVNSQRVRLKDVNELLSQSGLSERTYTILGQGLVDASLALKADERRKLFEEAAGVALYRVRRQETFRRLDNTRRNLERVLDIMSELEPRIRTLRRQARRAGEYIQLQDDLHALLREWYGYHWHKTQNELAEAREVLRQQEAHSRETREGYRSVQDEHTAFRERLGKLRERLSALHNESSDLHTQRELTSRELAVLAERQRALSDSKATLVNDRDRAVNEKALSQERLAEVETEVSQFQAELEQARDRLNAVQDALQARQNQRAGIQSKLEVARASLSSLGTQRAETQARLDELTARQKAGADRLDSVEKSIQEAKDEVSRAEHEHQAAQAGLKKIETAFMQASDDLAAGREQVGKLEHDKHEYAERISSLKADRSAMLAQLDVLDQAERSLTGYADGARFLLESAHQSRLVGAHGALSGMLDVPAELETAIAAALGENLDAVLLDGDRLEDALALLEKDEAGRAALLPLGGMNAAKPLQALNDPDCLGVAASLVNVSENLRIAVDALLGQVLVVRDRAAARRLKSAPTVGVIMVTLRGEVFRGDGVVLAGKSSRGSTLSRPRQQRELRQALDDSSARLASLETLLQSLTSDLRAAQDALARAEKSHRESRQALEEAGSVERNASLEVESAARALEWQEVQFKSLGAEATRTEADLIALVEKKQRIQTESAQLEEQVRDLTVQLSALVLDEAQEGVSYWKTRVAVTEQSLADAQTRQEERAGALRRLVEREEDFEKRLTEIESQSHELEAQRQDLHAREVSLNGQISELRLKIDPLEKELVDVEEKERELQLKDSNMQRSVTSSERIFNQVQVDVIRKQEALETLRARIQDDFGLVMFEYANDVSGPMPLPLDGMVEQLPVVNEITPELEEQMKRQRAQLRRMGPVNPEAQTDYDKEIQRFEFLKNQVDDLHKAEADLKQVIAELDELTQQEFSKTFEAVDLEFRQTFVRLFGGGSARLSLTDPDNLVDTGIEIQARLPGRREQGLALLSGGERSLTAIALVFALLKVSPTPVCVMDEVDAMLDEANVGRFRELLQELSKDTQFIIITHNRNTVQAAEVIYGVTMGRDSASQVISLRLDQITDEYIGRS
jgi:chromosome segregation protein